MMSIFPTKYIEPKLYTNDDDTIPILQFGESQHLSWFRGYRIQVSMTAVGQGDYGSSASSMSHDLRILNELDYPKEIKEKYRKLIFFSHVIEASNSYDEFIGWLKTNPVLFNEFAVKTAEVDYNFDFEDFDLKSLMDYVEVTEYLELPNQVGVALTISGGPKDNRLISSVVSIGADYIAISSFKDNKWHVLRMKDLFKEVSVEPTDFAEQFGVEWKALMSHMIFVVAFSANIYFSHYYARNYDVEVKEVPQSEFNFEYELIGDGKSIDSILRKIHEQKQKELITRREAEYNSSSISTDPLA